MAPFLFVFLLVASGFGGGLLLLSWYARKEDAPVLGPAALASAAGLAPKSPHEAAGERDGVALHARWTSVPRGRGSARRSAQVMRFVAHFEPPLELGIEIDAGALDDVERELGQSDALSLDHAPELELRARDHVLARELLGDTAVQRALRDAARRGALAVRDDRVVVGHDGWAIESDVVRRGVDAAHRVAIALRDAQSRRDRP